MGCRGRAGRGAAAAPYPATCARSRSDTRGGAAGLAARMGLLFALTGQARTASFQPCPSRRLCGAQLTRQHIQCTCEGGRGPHAAPRARHARGRPAC